MGGQDHRDIVAIAELMIGQFGRDAAAQVEDRAKRYRAEGDLERAEYWRNVAWVIQDMKVGS